MNSLISGLSNLPKTADIPESFITSLDISAHPLLKAMKKTRGAYFALLEYFVKAFGPGTDYTSARLSQYRTALTRGEPVVPLIAGTYAQAVKIFADDFLRPWKYKHRFLPVCDAALILSDESALRKICAAMDICLSDRKRQQLRDLLAALYGAGEIQPRFSALANLIKQFRGNLAFASRRETRIMVTANMSAGKSTLINAIVGKPVTRTSQEACTANLCYLYSKPFEDNRVHLAGSSLNLNVSYKDLAGVDKEAPCCVASYFRTSESLPGRVCLIDTPGVNSAINKAHGKLTRRAIVGENYDKLIYVLNANRLGTDEEIRHLKYVRENVPPEKVIFALNKLDSFNSSEDSIPDSIEGVKNDLRKIGYDTPVICPLSAYFALLLKMKRHNDELNEDEQDDFDLYAKKFQKPEYDLSAYYDGPHSDESQWDGWRRLSSLSGVRGLENILYGGTGE